MTPDRFARFQAKRVRGWPLITGFFGRLPAPLFEQALLVQHNLGTALSGTGQFSDILSRGHDHPLLYFHFWLLDTAPNLPPADRQTLEQHLLAAMVHTVTGVCIQQAIRDNSSNLDHRYIFLAQRLIQQADRHLSHLFPATTPFWTHHQQFWNEYSETTLADNPIPARRLALTKIPVTAAALALNRADDLPRLWQLVDRLNFIHQILADIASLRRDLFQGRVSYPIDKIRQALNLSAAAPLSPERALGAFVLTGAAQTIRRECETAGQSGRELAAGLKLPLFEAHFVALADLLSNIFGLFEVKKRGSSTQKQPAPPPNFFRPALEPRPTAIDMAERFLLADSTFRESWEVQRRGAFDVPEMTARAFPAGLIVEILARHGHKMSVAVGNIFAQLQATGCRYFDFAAMPPDSDDLGLLLRLHRYSAEPEAHRAILQPFLRRLAEAVEAGGQIPVWLPEPGSPVESMALWGSQCVAVEANVLLGLLDFDAAAFGEIIVRAVRSLTERWLARGWGALGHYTPAYWLWVGFEIMHQLQQSLDCTRLKPELANLQKSLGEYFRQTSQPAQMTPQTAALLSLAAQSPGNRAGVQSDPRWQTMLLKRQRYDGSWAGEPLYSTPTRGELAAWYSSRTVTTAFCYHTLKSCQS